MDARIETLPETKLVGIAASMTPATDTTPALWRALMPRRHEIADRADPAHVSMRVYDDPTLPVPELFSAQSSYEKWAAVEVTGSAAVPDGMRSYVIRGGLYAVVRHTGPASAFVDTLRRIFTEWLPASGYALDAREHFERLPPDWSASDPDAWEDIWIPVR